MPSKLDIAHATDVGRSYTINCDRTVAIGSDGLSGLADAFLLVADGMGANRKGETASRLTAEGLPDAFVRELHSLPAPVTQDQLAAALRKAAQQTNELIWKTAQETPDLKGMGSTMVAAAILGETVVICHAGDSRAYVLSGEEMLQVTADHSMIQEVLPGNEQAVELEARFGTVITRGMGLSRTLDADTVTTRLGPKDALLLCTDGLSNMVGDDAIAAVLAEAPDAATACQQLIAKANEAGGLDNIGVIVCRGPEFEPYVLASRADAAAATGKPTDRASSRRRLRRTNSILTVIIVAEIFVTVALGALAWWALSERNRLDAENAKIKKQFLQYVERAESRRR